MKYADYYAILGLERTADAGGIKKAYRRLARKYHSQKSRNSNKSCANIELIKVFSAAIT
jgi:curved DNA-binding protein CbpA